MGNKNDGLNVPTFCQEQKGDSNGFFYKFKGLSNFRFFLDILANNRLFAAKFGELNDPMEGVFQSQKQLTNQAIENLIHEKDEHRICSLTVDPTNPLMWAFYADKGAGCCIKLKLADDIKPVDVFYDETIQELTDTNLKVDEILRHKLSQWNNEKEWRVITEGNKEYVPINIDSIYWGLKISDEDFDFYKRLIDKVDSSIQVGRASVNKDGTYNLSVDNK